MTKLQQIFTKYKKECIAALIFVICLGIFSIGYAFAAVEPVRSIVIQSENTDFASGEEGSWQVTKSGYWTNYGEAEVTLDVDTTLMTNNQYTDIIFVLDISGSMSGEKLDRVKADSKELISSLLSNGNNRAALITFDSSSQIVSKLTNDEELLTNEIDNLQVTGQTNYYQALVNVGNILQDYQKESGREMIVLFLTDGYPNVDTPNQVTQYQYLKSVYPYLTINGIQYEMGDSILNPIKEISDNQFIADMETLNNVLFDASVAPTTYDTYQIIDYIENENFTLESANDIKVSQGSVELTEEDGRQKITWTLDNLSSGRTSNLTMKIKLKDEFVGQGGIYSTNDSTEVISKLKEQAEDVTTSNTPILNESYQVIYDGNAPDGCNVSNVPETYNYSVFSTIEISDKVPTCEGYQFMGWTIETKDVTRVGKDYFIMPESNVVIKAEWSKIGITKFMNGTVSNMADPIMEGYGWFDDASISTSQVTSIVTKDNLEIPSTATEYWDASDADDGSVIAYIEDDGRGAGTYKLTIGGQGGVIASDGYYLFGGNSSSGSFSSIETIDLKYLDTSQVTNMYGMFYNCSSLTGLNLSSFDTGKVTNMARMFSSCRSLINITFGNNYDTSQVTNMSYMFYYCSNLTSLDLSSFNTIRVTNMSYMFYLCGDIMGLDLSTFDTSNVTNMGGMFQSCSSLTSLNVKGWNTSQVTTMTYMFSSCRSLTSLDLSTFDTSQVTDMSWMFNGCSSLTSLNLRNFDTSQVTTMTYMFYRCGDITGLDLSTFDTSQVTNMGGMFRECSSLTSLNLRNFDTSQVTTMFSMLSGCSSLISLDLSTFDTSQVTNMYDMFLDCSNIKSITFGSKWNTSSVTNMGQMFRNCSSLTNLNLSRFNTSSVTIMDYMFCDCSALTSLDLSTFDTTKTTNMRDMFSGCTSLMYIDMRNMQTSHVQSNMYDGFLSFVPNGITIIVKDATTQSWIQARLKSANRTGTVTIASV